MRRGFQPALEEIIVSTRHPAFEKRSYRSAGVLRDLELHGPAGLLLDDNAARLYVSAGRHIANLQPDEVAAPELAVDCEVEEDERPHFAFNLEPYPARPDLVHFQRWLLTGQLAGGQTSRPRCS